MRGLTSIIVLDRRVHTIQRFMCLVTAESIVSHKALGCRNDNHRKIIEFWRSTIEYLMIREMERWPMTTFLTKFERQSERGNVFFVRLAYRTIKAPMLQAVQGKFRRSLEVESLCIAAAANHYALVEFFIEQGIDVEGAYPAPSPHGPFHPRLRDEWCDATLEDGQDLLFVPQTIYASPLYASAEWGGDESTMRLLLEHGACPNSRSFNHERPALFGVLRSSPRNGEDRATHVKSMLSRIRLLLKYGANPKATAEGGESVLHYAADCGYTEVMEFLIGVDIGLALCSYENMTLLQRTCAKGHLAATRMLLEKGLIDIDYANGEPSVDGYTALGRAVDNYGPFRSKEPRDALVQVLLDYNADPDGGDQQIPPLTIAIDGNNPNITHMLLEARANVEKRDTKRHWTPLESCLSSVLYGSTDMSLLDLLLSYGADPNKRFTSGHTPLVETVLAPSGRGRGRDWRKHMVLETLLWHGADVSKPARNGVTALSAIDLREGSIMEKQCTLEILRPHSKGKVREGFDRRSKELQHEKFRDLLAN